MYKTVYKVPVTSKIVFHVSKSPYFRHHRCEKSIFVAIFITFLKFVKYAFPYQQMKRTINTFKTELFELAVIRCCEPSPDLPPITRPYITRCPGDVKLYICACNTAELLLEIN